MVTRRVWWLGAALASLGCTDDTYVIGAVCGAVATCPAAGVGGAGNLVGMGGAPGGTAGNGAAAQGGFTLDLTGSGVERLPQALFGQGPTHFLVSSDAEVAAWPARVGDGFDALPGAALVVDEPWPFADRGSALSHAGAVAFSANSAWAELADGALALEAVFRAEPGSMLLTQRDASGGLTLSLDAQGALGLQLTAGGNLLSVSSGSLVADAWHHCLVLVDAAEGAQMVCNGQAGELVSVPQGFALSNVMAAAKLGGGAPGRLRWAELASWQSGTWGPHGAWADAARARFARLTGTYAEGANAPLPFADVRASGAYIDMSPADAPERRRLHPVGQHWPRVVCRPTPERARLCGLLAETSSSQQLSPDSFTLDHWAAGDVAVARGVTLGPLGDASLFALTPSTKAVEHVLDFDVSLADGPVVWSFFARAGSAKLVRAEVVGVASATYDLSTATVQASRGTRVVSAEPWGDGLVRLSYSFDVAPGPGKLRLSLLADDGSASFAGNGEVAVELGDGELHFRSFSTPLPTFGAIQAKDLLVFPAGNGNFPNGGAFRIEAEIWLPEAPLLADAAILNANFATQYEQQIDLFVTAQQGAVRFNSLRGQIAPWNITSSQTVTDGKLHHVVASVSAGQATLDVDDTTTHDAAAAYDTSTLDRIEVGASQNSSGPLTGILRQLSITAP